MQQYGVVGWTSEKSHDFVTGNFLLQDEYNKRVRVVVGVIMITALNQPLNGRQRCHLVMLRSSNGNGKYFGWMLLRLWVLAIGRTRTRCRSRRSHRIRVRGRMIAAATVVAAPQSCKLIADLLPGWIRPQENFHALVITGGSFPMDA